MALATAFDALAAVDEQELLDHEQVLLEKLAAGIAELPGAERLRIWSDSTDPVGVVTFVIEGHDPGLVAAYLAAEHGVGVRDGLFCAHPLLQRLGYPRGAVRASVGIGTTSDEVDRLLAGLNQFVARGPENAYEVVDGCWVVLDDPRPVPAITAGEELVPTAACGAEV